MVKSGTIKPVLLLTLIGMIIIGMVQPIAATGQDSCKDDCQDSSSGQMSEQDSSREECSDSSSKQMCEQDLAKDNYQDSCKENYPTETDMDNANSCMKKAMMIHEMHMKNPGMATNESNMEMMKQMMQAHKCLTREKMDMEMMDKAADNKTAGYDRPYIISDMTRCDCSCFWLDEAVKLHEMHVKNPETATSESQMRLMVQMTRANGYLEGKGMDMEMAKNASFSQDNVNFTDLWLEKAIKLHAMHLKNPEAATNESQMRLMNEMMRARECTAGKDMNMEMLMDFEEDSASEMRETSPRGRMMCSMMMDSMKMGEKSCNETMMSSMMSSMMEEKAAKKEKMDCMMEEKAAKKDKMECMMEEKLANESCYASKMDQKANLTKRNMDDIGLCLEKAIKLHEMNLRNPEAATSESKMEMMKQMMQAHEYLTGEKMDMEMMNETAGDKFAEWINETPDKESAEWMNAAVDSGSAKCKDTTSKSESSGC